MSTPRTQPQNQQVVNAQQSHSERFTNMVIKEFTSNAGELKLTSFQKKLFQSYFLKMDSTLKDAEKKRLAKDEKYRDPLPITWENINILKLSQDVVSFSTVGLDPMQPNHINLIPYKNSVTNKYDIGCIIGYRGCELKAKKYGLDVPDNTIIELVFSKDKFTPIKKDSNSKIENYIFEIVSPFDRGDMVGGFYYHEYKKSPEKNVLVIFSKEEIEKRKPLYASAEFWGGEKDKWENGKRVGKEKIEGWYNEMCYKTLCRAAYNSITIDSEKIDEHYQRVIKNERESSAESAILNLNAAKASAAEEAEVISFESAKPAEPVQIVAQNHTVNSNELTDEEKAEIAREEAELAAKGNTLFGN